MEMALELAPRRYARRARRGRMTAIGGFNTGIRKGVLFRIVTASPRRVDHLLLYNKRATGGGWVASCRVVEITGQKLARYWEPTWYDSDHELGLFRLKGKHASATNTSPLG